MGAYAKKLSPICGKIILAASKHFNLQISSIKVRSVAFRSYYIDHYLQAGVQSPGSLKGLKEVQSAINYLFTKEGIDDCQRAMDFWLGTYLPEDWFLPRINAKAPQGSGLFHYLPASDGGDLHRQ